MRFVPRSELFSYLKSQERKTLTPHYLISLDVGSSFVGCAVSTQDNTKSSPQGTWIRSPDNKNLIGKCEQLVFRQKKLGNTLAGFVVGFPYHGSEDPTNTTDKSGKQVLQFIKEMSLHGQMLAHSYTFSTERCTSKIAERKLLRNIDKRKQRGESIRRRGLNPHWSYLTNTLAADEIMVKYLNAENATWVLSEESSDHPKLPRQDPGSWVDLVLDMNRRS